MAIARETVDRIRAKIDIVELITEYVPNLKPAGKDYKALCPFHSEKTPSFFVSPSKNIFHCFGCKAGGDVIKFVMQIENITYPEAIMKLAKRVGVEIKEEIEEDQVEKKTLIEILSSAAKFYHKYLTSLQEAARARKYLAERKVNQDTIEKFQLGYAPDGNKLFEQAKKKYSQELLLKSGLIAIREDDSKPYDFLRNRITFPIYDISGNVIAFGGRAISNSIQPVYLNTSDTILFNKSKTLYGLFHAKPAINKKKQVIFVEGYFDVILCHQGGIDNIVAPLGTAVTQEHIKVIRRFAEGGVVFLFDSDESGKEAGLRAAEICIENDLQCRIATLPQGIDPDEFILQFGHKSLEEIIEHAANPVEFKTDMCLSKFDIKKVENKSKVVKEILATVVKIRDPVYRQEMIKFVANKLELKEDILISEIRKLTGKKKLDPKESVLPTELKNIRSIEEEITSLCLKYPEIAQSISLNIFEDERCKKVLSQLHRTQKDFSYTKFLDLFDEDISSWLIQIAFEDEDREYNNKPQEMLNVLLKDLNLQRQEERRRQLEIEVIPMWEGRKEVDMKKIHEFEKLTKMLKGTSGGS
ncbi:MAG: DNA primase [Elusimicrobiota bacterium]|nr:DNA primase [Elusimicrobiota bacterium]